MPKLPRIAAPISAPGAASPPDAPALAGSRCPPARPRRAFLSYLADTGASLPTVVRHHTAIRHAHVPVGDDLLTRSAAVAEVMAGMRRTLGRPPRGKEPPLTSDLALLVSSIDRADPDHGLAARRDRALLLVAFTTALRRSELSALTWPDVTVESSTADGSDGAALVFNISRGTPTRSAPAVWSACCASLIRPAGRLCLVRALLAWHRALGHDLHAQQTPPGVPAGRAAVTHLHGPVFRPSRPVSSTRRRRTKAVLTSPRRSDARQPLTGLLGVGNSPRRASSDR